MTTNGEIYDRVREAQGRFAPAGIVTVVKGEGLGVKLAVIDGETVGTLGDEALDAFAVRHVWELIDAERSETIPAPSDISSKPHDARELFFDVYPAPPTLLIFGAVHAAQPLTRIAKMLGFRVIVTDARAKLATEERFPEADAIHVEWPDQVLAHVPVYANTYLAILTHDPKFDEPALIGALETRAPYIGAVGSRKTNRDRRERLRDAGVSDESIGRVRGPIGLDIGADTPEEMAISIISEIIAVRHGRDGGPLTAAAGAIRGSAT